MYYRTLCFGVATAALIALCLIVACSGQPRQAQAVTHQQLIDRGEYLVNVGGCHHCHSPKIMTPQGPEVDSNRMLSGHPASGTIPEIQSGTIGAGAWGALTTHDLTAWAGPWGISFASNLTPDEVTGIGAWLESSFIAAMRNGRHLGTGRPILPPMPWQDLGKMTDDDLKAIFAYLKSIKPINNMVPLPVPPQKIGIGHM